MSEPRADPEFFGVCIKLMKFLVPNRDRLGFICQWRLFTNWVLEM